MNGTSLDGIDVATITTDGEAVAGFRPRATRPYDAGQRALLRPTLIKMTIDELGPARLESAGAAGRSAEALEARAFALSGSARRRGLPPAFPGTTGVAHAMTGSVIAKPVRT